jgi:hypothetical protein
VSSLFAAPVAYFVGRSFVNDSIDYDANGRYKDYPIMTRSIFVRSYTESARSNPRLEDLTMFPI